jgi:hypothetical protein
MTTDSTATGPYDDARFTIAREAIALGVEHDEEGYLDAIDNAHVDLRSPSHNDHRGTLLRLGAIVLAAVEAGDAQSPDAPAASESLAQRLAASEVRVAAWRALALAELDYVPHPASVEDRCALEKRRGRARPGAAWEQ